MPPETSHCDCSSARVGSICYVTDRPVVTHNGESAQHFTLGEMLSSPHPEIRVAAQTQEDVVFGGTTFTVIRTPNP